MGVWFSLLFTPASKLVIINEKKYIIERLIGEGSFSYVYLVTEPYSRKKFALKKTLCQTPESFEGAKKEIQVLKSIKHENVLQLIDSQVINKGNEVNEVYMVMPFYKRGTLYDILTFYHQAKKHMAETEILQIFLSICKGLNELHKLQLSHNDIKPGNILISDDNKPILMDFGSVSQARYMIMNRQEALKLQEFADSHCTPSFRAPELYDISSDALIDERSDIWSIGCTLYALAFYQSPFEVENESGSIALAVKSGKIPFPSDAGQIYTKQFLQLIQSLLVVDPHNRAFIDEVIELVSDIISPGN